MASVACRVPFIVAWATAQSAATHGTFTFVYDSAEPLSVRLDFGNDPAGEPLVWTFGRDVLADGLTQRAGSGDVRCWTEDTWFHIVLASPDGTVELKVFTAAVRAFLVEAEDLVPYGAETLDFDAELDALLGGTR